MLYGSPGWSWDYFSNRSIKHVPRKNWCLLVVNKRIIHPEKERSYIFTCSRPSTVGNMCLGLVSHHTKGNLSVGRSTWMLCWRTMSSFRCHSSCWVEGWCFGPDLCSGRSPWNKSDSNLFEWKWAKTTMQPKVHRHQYWYTTHKRTSFLSISKLEKVKKAGQY